MDMMSGDAQVACQLDARSRHVDPTRCRDDFQEAFLTTVMDGVLPHAIPAFWPHLAGGTRARFHECLQVAGSRRDVASLGFESKGRRRNERLARTALCKHRPG
ncbi:hypothetical protein UB46_20350 [Burkholderiaceae bacterium 16]|nr:hypothetical protein UB46_20350 [Burkholderiaceae bacterium 16]